MAPSMRFSVQAFSMLIDSEVKFQNLVEALRMLTPQGEKNPAISQSGRAILTGLIAKGWSPADAVACFRDTGGRLQ